MVFELTGISKANFRHLDGFFSKDGDHGFRENIQEFSLPHARIRSHEWLFDGIRMGYSDWHFETPGNVGWRYEIRGDLVTLQANISGTIFFDGQQEPLFRSRQHNLFYSHRNEVSEGVLTSDGLRASMFFMQFKTDAFLRLTGNASDALDRFSSNILAGQNSILSPGNLPLSPAMMSLIQSIVNCPYADGLKRMFLLSRGIEFLVQQAELCNVPLPPASRYIKTTRDQDCIAYAYEYVTKKLLLPPSLSELSRIVGINEYKLKRGFKEMYGTTVFGYISDARLEIARTEILTSQKSISIIAEEMGYSSLQHFSGAFKKKFGVAPRDLRYKSRL